MGESVIVRQNNRFEVEILAVDPHDPEADEYQPVESIYHLTPYGMLLASVGTCTGVVLHTYAQYHDVHLDEVEFRLTYDRAFREDCEHCEDIDEYAETIEDRIVLFGDLTPQERKRLFMVSKHCPIHKMLVHGIEVKSRLVEDGEQWP